jgi:hypothetical protein
MPVELQWSGQNAGHRQNSFLNGPVDCLGGFLNVRCSLSLKKHACSSSFVWPLSVPLLFFVGQSGPCNYTVASAQLSRTLIFQKCVLSRAIFFCFEVLTYFFLWTSQHWFPCIPIPWDLSIHVSSIYCVVILITKNCKETWHWAMFVTKLPRRSHVLGCPSSETSI